MYKEGVGKIVIGEVTAPEAVDENATGTKTRIYAAKKGLQWKERHVV